MNCVPEKPREVAADLNPRDVDDRVIHPERYEHALGRILICLERLTAPQVSYIARGNAPLLDRHGSDARRFLRIHGCGGIADDEYFRVAFQLKVRIHDGAANA